MQHAKPGSKEVDGKKTEAPGDLQRAVGLAPPGTDIKVKVWREGTERTVDVKIGEAPDERESQQRGGGSRGGAPSVLGMEVRPITPEVARQLNLKTSEGVIVARVDEGSAAAEAGIQRGDVIREINRQKIRSTGDYERLTHDVKDGDRLTSAGRCRSTSPSRWARGRPGGGLRPPSGGPHRFGLVLVADA